MVNVEKYLKKDIDKKTEKSIKAFADSIVMNRQREAFRLLFATDLHYKSDNVLCFGTIKKLKEMVMCATLIKPDLFVLNGDLKEGHSEKRIITAELSELFDNLKVLDRIPVNPKLAAACDRGMIELAEVEVLDNTVKAIEEF